MNYRELFGEAIAFALISILLLALIGTVVSPGNSMSSSHGLMFVPNTGGDIFLPY